MMTVMKMTAVLFVITVTVLMIKIMTVYFVIKFWSSWVQALS